MAAHWHILGAGSIGCLWAAHLAKAGHRVTLILRNPERLDTFKKNGAVVLESDGKQHLFPVNACLPANCGPISHLLITTKAYDTLPALKPIAHQLTHDACVVVMQNGMGAQQETATRLAPINVWAASTTDGAWLKEPFHVVFAGKGETKVGPLLQTVPSLPTIPTELAPSDLTLVADEQIELSLWRKLAINCAINPLTAYYDCRNGELAEDPSKFQHMSRVCAEIDQLCQQLKLQLFDGPAVQQAEAVARATGANFSSMLQDVRHKRKTELDYITGYLLQQAKQVGLALPENQTLYEHLKKTTK